MARHTRTGMTQPMQTRTPSQGPTGLKRFVKTPKGTVMTVLILLTLIGITHAADMHGVINVAIAVVTAIVIDLVVALLQRRQKVTLPDGGMVTALIVGLVVSSTVSWYIVAITTTIAVLSKHLLKIGRKPLFNPAAFGLLVSIYAFSIGESWWGDLSGLPGWAIVVVIGLGYYVTHRVNKFPQTFSFIAVYCLVFLLFGVLHLTGAASPTDAFRNPVINSALFLTFFMMTDPPTSPAKYSHQIFFGAITALVSCGIYLLLGGLTYLLIGVLVGNLWKASMVVFTAGGQREQRSYPG